MNNIIKTASSSEPLFDSIRRVNEDGQECWYARELQEILGYRQWKEFQKVIDSAIENLETVTDDVTRHVESRRELSSVSNPVPLQDYNLSRLACYHIALACDSRGKPEVKLAKHYFVVKARKAEIAEAEAEAITADSFKALHSKQLSEIRDALTNPGSLSPAEFAVLTDGISPALVVKIGALTNDQYVKLYLERRAARVPQDIQDQKKSGIFTAAQVKIADETIERFDAIQPAIERRWQQAIGSGTGRKILEIASNR